MAWLPLLRAASEWAASWDEGCLVVRAKSSSTEWGTWASYIL